MSKPESTITVTVLYFAALREEAGCDRQRLTTTATTPELLYRQLQQDRQLSFPADHLRVAINESFADWQSPLKSGDTIAFLTPVAGG